MEAEVGHWPRVRTCVWLQELAVWPHVGPVEARSHSWEVKQTSQNTNCDLLLAALWDSGLLQFSRTRYILSARRLGAPSEGPPAWANKGKQLWTPNCERREVSCWNRLTCHAPIRIQSCFLSLANIYTGKKLTFAGCGSTCLCYQHLRSRSR